MKKIVFVALLSLIFTTVISQVSINEDGSDPDGSSMLDVKSTNKGLLVPRMTTVQRADIDSPANGLFVYDVNTQSFWYYNETDAEWIEMSEALWGHNMAFTYMANDMDYLGIGTDSPTEKVELSNGNLKISGDESLNELNLIIEDQFSGNEFSFNGYEYLSIRTNGSERVVVLPNGNTGVGTSSPAERLHIAGSIRISDGSEAEGRVLTSDENGTASWTELPEIGDNDWELDGDDMYSEVSGNVGIGTVTPGATLDVGGHIWQSGTGQSVFIGEGAGENDNLLNNSNVFVGYEAGNSNIDGDFNVAIGHSSLNSNTGGLYNTAVGTMTLYSNDGGSRNTAAGYQAMRSNTFGNYNTAYGFESLEANTEGENNTAVGYNALVSNTLGGENTAIGTKSMCSNTTGIRNTAVGYEALYSNSTGQYNTAVGFQGLNENTTGNSNTAFGHEAMGENTTGYSNTAAGYASMHNNTTGDQNVGVGQNALFQNTEGSYNTALGYYSLSNVSTGNNNVALGYRAGEGDGLHTKSGGVFIGYRAGEFENEDNKLYIENSNSSTPLIGGDFDTDEVYINGKIKIAGGNPGENKVLTSDENGMATWSPPVGNSGVGASMFTSYMIANNMFTPHENNCGAEDAFIPLFSGASIGFCMERNPRPAQLWVDAVRTCLSQGKRLPEPGEWQHACFNSGLYGLNNLPENQEWISNFPRSTNISFAGGTTGSGVACPIGAVAPGSTCAHMKAYGWIGQSGVASSEAFRCVR